MPGTSTNRLGPSIRQPLRQPRPQNHHERDITDRTSTNDEDEDDGVAFRQEPTEDGEGVILNDEHVIHHHLAIGSALSKLPTSGSASSNFTPQHDKEGKPIKSHGPETFGDIMLHPIKQLELHRRRLSVFEHEKHDWDEKHHDHPLPATTKTAPTESADHTQIDASAPASTAVDEEAPVESIKPTVKTVIHFKHLMGEQAVRVTKPVVDQLMDPLSLTGDEVLQLYKVKDTDDLVEFFHHTKRDYSLKIHKTVNLHQKKEDLRAEIDEKRHEIEEKTRFKFKEHAHDSEKSNDSLVPMVLPKGAIELNENVFLELRVIEKEVEPEKESTRRPIFALPDPDLSDEIGQETSATWVELFSDVFYVGWLSSFTHSHHMVSSDSLATYIGWFVVMWWTWCSSALYSARYDNGDVMHHIYKIIDLCGLIGMAGASEGYSTSNSKGFIIGYMVMKAVLLIQYSVVLWAATLSGSFARRPLSMYVSVNALAILLWGVSLLYSGAENGSRNETICLILWYISIGIEVLVNMSLQRFKQVSLAASHLAERFGLFTIIILGENCIGFVKMVSESHAEVRVVVANMFGLVIIFLFFFMYFDDFSKEILNSVQVSQIWMYLHFPLHLCQVAFGIAMTDIITSYRLHFDKPVDAAISLYHECLALEEGSGSHTGTNETTPATAVGHAAYTMVQSFTKAIMMASASAGDSENADKLSACEELGGSDDSLNYVFKAFWISGGLILSINALIKLVNTPVRAKWSRVICGSRLLNAAVFFGLSAASFGNFNGLGMLGIMMACLLLQSTVASYYSFTDNTLKPLPPPPPLGSHNHPVSSRLDDITIPAYVSKLHLNIGSNTNGNVRPTAKDHSLKKVIGKTSYRLCLRLRGEKGANTCSYLLSGRPWRLWRQQLSQVTVTSTIWYCTVLNNWFVKNVIHNSIDTLEALQWKINDWRQSPSLEWYLLKATWSSFMYRFYDIYLYWNNYLQITTYHSRRGIDTYRKHINLNHFDLEPDNEGCYHDIFGTTLCVGEQSMLDDDELKHRMNTLFEAMTYEDRTHMLRFQQRFIQWATKSSTMTTKAVDQAQSIWLQHTQSAYQFLDDSLNLVPSCTNTNNNHGRQSSSHSFYHSLSSIVPATTAENTCANIIFPFSVSPFDNSLGTSSFSFGNSLPSRSHSLLSTSSCTPPTRSLLKLIPTRQKQWSTCIKNQKGHVESKMSTDQYITMLSQPLESYNRIQYHYMLSRLEKEMLNKLKRLEKEALQEYYRAMLSAPHIWKINYHRDQQRQDKRQQQQEHEQRQRPGYATQRMYQQLRLYTTISFRQMYTKSIHQLMEATRRYDTLAMEQVTQAHQEWKWVEQQRQNQIHDHHYHILQEHRHQDVDYDDQCQQWWRKNKPWRLIHLLSSVAEQLGYYHHNKSKNKTMDDEDYTLLSAIASYIPSAQDPPLTTPADTRAAIYISQRADMALQVHRKTVLNQWTTAFQEIDRRSHSMWVSAMDQVQGRHRLLPGCNATCAFGILLAKLLVLALFLLLL